MPDSDEEDHDELSEQDGDDDEFRPDEGTEGDSGARKRRGIENYRARKRRG
jgi:hypothetical protein